MALYNLSAEQSVLGSILIEPESILVANQFNLCVNDFFHPQHQILYNCIKKMHDSGDAIDFVTLKHNLEKTDLLEKAGGVSYFTSLTSAVPTTKNIDYHIKILKELATKRNIYNLISDKAKTIKKMNGQDMIKLANEVKATVVVFTALGDGVTSALISFLRTLLFQLLALIFLPMVLGIEGVWLAVTAAEAGALCVTVLMFITKDKVFHYRKASC